VAGGAESRFGGGLVKRHGLANQRRQRLLIDPVALVYVDGPAGVCLEARVEEACGILEGGAFREGEPTQSAQIPGFAHQDPMKGD
jgi:hypothetical protein